MATALVTVVFLFNVTLSLLFTTMWIQNMKKEIFNLQPSYLSEYEFVIHQIKTFVRDIFKFDSLQKITAYLGVYLLLHFYLKSLLEFVSQYTNKKMLNLIKCLNNIVESTLLYSFIVGFLLAYMFITNYQLSLRKSEGTQIVEEQFSYKLIYNIIETFFIGRILFSAGYLIGIATGCQSFRSYGVGLTMATAVISLASIQDLNLWTYF